MPSTAGVAVSSARGTAKTRPEIYARGFRNPFKMSVDKATGVVYLGDYGPDGGAIAGREHAVALPLEQTLEVQARRRRVVDHED